MTNINTDLTGRDRCAAVATAFSQTQADVYSGALGVGLTIYLDPDMCRVLVGTEYRALVLTDWDGAIDATAVATAVTVSTDDATRVTTIADYWGVPEDEVRSKCLATGLAFLSGVEEYIGPVLR